MKPASVLVRKFFEYSGIGISVFVLEYLCYVILVTYGGMGYLAATVITFLSGSILQYAVTRQVVFRNTTRAWTSGYFLFLLIALLGVALISGSMVFLVEYLRIDQLLARPVAGAFVGIVSFLLNDYGTFRTPKVGS